MNTVFIRRGLLRPISIVLFCAFFAQCVVTPPVEAGRIRRIAAALIIRRIVIAIERSPALRARVERRLIAYLAKFPERRQVVQRLAKRLGITIEGGAVEALSAEGRALLNAKPVGEALKTDIYHRGAAFMRQRAAEAGRFFRIVGGDGKPYTLTQISGDLNNVTGRFEYIVNENGELTHQLFVRNGTINGIPITP